MRHPLNPEKVTSSEDDRLAAGGGAEKEFKTQMAKGKWQMENHLLFALCHLICSFGL